MVTEFEDTLHIARSPEAVYDYLTQPWHWHEWHPASRRAAADIAVLGVGDRFDEEIELQPLAPLPPRLRRSTRYEVLLAERPRAWRARGETGDGWLELDYRFEPDGDGTRFTRRLAFEVGGPLRLFTPLLRARVRRQTREALRTLRRRLERPATGK